MPIFYGKLRSECVLGPLTFTHTEYEPGTALAAHAHARRYISVLLRGQYTEVVETVPRLCQAGSVIHHEATENHADYFQEPASILNVVVENNCSATRAIEHLKAWLERVKYMPLSVSDLFPKIADLVGRRKKPRAKSPMWLERILTRVDWTESGSLEHVARTAGIHPTHLARSFHRHVGTTAVAHRRSERIRMASQFLLTSNSTLAEIAYATGFFDQSHFTNAFRRTIAMTPAAYRQAFRR